MTQPQTQTIPRCGRLGSPGAPVGPGRVPLAVALAGCIRVPLENSFVDNIRQVGRLAAYKDLPLKFTPFC